MTKKVLLIGGGTGGHILPLAPLARELEKQNAQVEIIVADAPLDRALIRQSFSKAKAHYFRTDKIRRYLSIKNLAAPFRITASILRAHKLIKKIKPNAIFFKGGFVGFPFLIAARIWHHKITLFSHESDISPGALTKFAKKWCHRSFESFGTPPMPLYYSPARKASPAEAKTSSDKKNLLVLGGSQGAQWINEKLEKECNDICNNYNIIAITGRGKKINCTAKNFSQVELLPADELAKKIQKSDIIVSRAGANSLFEIIAAKKPSVIIPLPSAARDHQTLNAKWFKKQGLCHVLNQSQNKKLLKAITEAQNDKVMTSELKKSSIKNSAPAIAKEIIRAI